MSNMTTCGVGLVITTIFCVRCLGFEVCYDRSNSSGHVRRLTCVWACCDSGSDKYCCGALLEDEQAETENDTQILDTEMDGKAIGTIVAGVVVFLVIVVAAVACCVCKPSCGQVESVLQDTPQTVPHHFSVTTKNPMYTSGALNPGYPMCHSHQYT